ncbi:hypothetical protein L9W92_18280, partial [Pelotomaculum terephthalicicum JT]|uniref:hypothetical protein n=1 Tax=Pelotomaculum terephthalicicum TaxID=206393 RepID=UPI001F038A70
PQILFKKDDRRTNGLFHFWSLYPSKHGQLIPAVFGHYAVALTKWFSKAKTADCWKDCQGTEC